MKLTHCRSIVRPAGQLLPPEGIEASSSKSDTIDQHHRDVVKSLKITLNKSAVTAICYSHDNERIAVATKDRIITLYNHKGEQVDRFNTKQNSNYADGDTTKKDYIIRSIQFAPPCSADHHDDSGKDQLQSPKLAVAQSDAIVFIYKWKSHNQHPRGKKNNSTQHGDQHNDEGLLMMEQARKKSNTGIHTGTTLTGSSSSSCKWSGKKSISNKFMEDSPITALVWSRKHPYQVVYGLHQGKIRIGNLRTNKAQTLYKGSSDTAAADKNDSNPVISLALNLNGTELLSGHQDGSIYKFIFPTSTSTKIKSSACTNLIKVSIIPYTLSWGRSICIGGTNGKISFYSHDGQEEQCFVYNNNNNNNNTKNTDHEGVSTMLQHNHELTSEEKSRISSQFTTSIFSPSGDDVIVGSFDCFYLFSWSAATKCWEERNIHIVKNMYSITALDWKANGSSIVLGTSSGLIDEYDATFRQFTYKDSFLITYVSPSQLLIRDKDEVNSCPILIQSSKGREIVKVKIYHDPGTTVYRYVVASTKQSLILCDMESPLSSTSEIPWSFQKELHEKFIFDAANACVISNAGELSIVEYGQNKILDIVRTEYTSPFLLSLRVNEDTGIPITITSSSSQGLKSTKVVAYLLDQQTICIRDLNERTNPHAIEHEYHIDFLELNTRGNVLVFRDKKRNLYLFNTISRTKSFLLSYCGYVQWIPDSDVIVAQSKNKMYVWYNINSINQVSTVDVNGEIEGIERVNDRTDVIINEDGSMVTHPLSEELINFTTALQDGNMNKCVKILENVEKGLNTIEMWQELKLVSFKSLNLPVALRCAAALGNISETRYLRKVIKNASGRGAVPSNNDDWEVRVSLLKISKEFVEAERILLSHNKIDEAINMYENMMMFQDAIRITKLYKQDCIGVKQDSYCKWLMENGYEEKAAIINCINGDNICAINICLDAGLPGKAANIVFEKNIVQPKNVLEDVARALHDSGMFSESGAVYERLGQTEKAVSLYLESRSFRAAINLASAKLPSKVIEIKHLWGDYLVSCRDYTSAIEHFVDAHSLLKAAEAAIDGKMWQRATEIVERFDGSSPKELEKLASKFITGKRFDDAKALYLKVNLKRNVVIMYINNTMFEEAEREASNLLLDDEKSDLFEAEAKRFVELRNFNVAEKLFLICNKPDLVIEMWKNEKEYDKAMHFVNGHRPDLKEDLHMCIAKESEKAGKLSESAAHYLHAGNWLGAVNMYRKNDMWNEAIKVAQSAELDVLDRVAYAYSIHMGESAQESLLDLGLLDHAIRFAIENKSFETALDLAKDASSKQLIASIHLKFANFLEQNEKYNDAEVQYLDGGSPSDAIEMYLDLEAWTEAERIAVLFDKGRLSHIYNLHARNAVQNGDFETAEEQYIKAKSPENVFDMYKENLMWKDASRIADRFLPHLVDEIPQPSVQQLSATSDNIHNSNGYFRDANALEEAGKYDEAIDEYLSQNIDSVSDSSKLEELWDNAIRVVISKCPKRRVEVSKEVANRLFSIGRILKAAELMYQSNNIETAVNMLIGAKQWELAKSYAQGDPYLTNLCTDTLKESLVETSNTTELLALGDVKGALNVMMNDGQWDKIWITLQDRNLLNETDDSYTEYTAIRVRELLSKKNVASMSSILKTLLEQKAPSPDFNEPSHFKLYLTLVQQILGLDYDSEQCCDYCTILKELRSILVLTFKKYKSSSEHEHRGNIELLFHRLILTTHYAYMSEVCVSNDMSLIACKCSISLLKQAIFRENDEISHTIVPSDKAFYKVGMLCRHVGDNHLAFFFLNRYIDIVEAMEESDCSDYTQGGLISTDIPFDSNISTGHYVADAIREEIRDWVLEACIDSSIGRNPPSISTLIKGELHEGLYNYTNSHHCIVTGYPIPQELVYQHAKVKSNKEDWDSIYNRLRIIPWNEDF